MRYEDRLAKKAWEKQYSLKWAIPDEEIENVARQLVNLVMSIPEADRAAWHASSQRRACLHPKDRKIQPGFYDLTPAIGVLTKLMNHYWKTWPLQAADEPARRDGSSRTTRPDGSPGAGRRVEEVKR